VKVTNN